MTSVAVLAYHRVGPPPPGSWETWYSVRGERFLEHLRILEEGGWEPIDAGRLLRGLDEPGTLPRRSALITFDDGFRSLRGAALEWLDGRPAVVFVPTGFVGGINAWDEGTREPLEPLCDWDDLAELERRGVAVEAHGVTHRAFSTLTAGEVEREVRESKSALERMLGKRVSLIAYPYGDAGESRAIVRSAGYRAGFLYDGPPLRFPIESRFELERVPIGSDTDLEADLARVRERAAL